MVKKICLFMSVSSLILCFAVMKPVHAVFIKLTPEQIQEAIEYGQKNKNNDIAAFSRPWTVCLDKGKGCATLFTPYHNIAYKARKCAVERKEFTNKNVLEALDIGDTLTFSVTVYGDEYDFAMHYSARVYQKEEVIQPEFEFAPAIADASEFWPDSPEYSARLVFKFPIKDIDTTTPITLAVVAPGGDETLFVFDLPKIN